VASAATLLLALPALLLARVAWEGPGWIAWCAGAVGVAVGAVGSVLGMRLARTYDRRAPELLASLRGS
jgi:hypothetical protein